MHISVPQINEDLQGEVNFLTQTGPFHIPLVCSTKKCDVSPFYAAFVFHDNPFFYSFFFNLPISRSLFLFIKIFFLKGRIIFSYLLIFITSS